MLNVFLLRGFVCFRLVAMSTMANEIVEIAGAAPKIRTGVPPVRTVSIVVEPVLMMMANRNAESQPIPFSLLTEVYICIYASMLYCICVPTYGAYIVYKYIFIYMYIYIYRIR